MTRGIRVFILIILLMASESLFAQEKIMLFRDFYHGQSTDDLLRIPGVKLASADRRLPAGTLVQEDKFLEQPSLIAFFMQDKKLTQVSVLQKFSLSSYKNIIKSLGEQGFAASLVESPTQTYDIITNARQDRQAMIQGISAAEAAGINARQMTVIMIPSQNPPKLATPPANTYEYLKALPPSRRIAEIKLTGQSVGIMFYSPAMMLQLANRGPKERF